MKLLAVEASGAQVGIAAVESVAEALPQARAVLGSSEPRSFAREVIAGIDSTLQRASWQLDDVEALAVGLGPGSWTSLRIGLSTAKTLAQARGWQLAGVPTFDALAKAVWRAAVQASTELNGAGSRLPSHFILVATARCRPGEIYSKIFECRPVGLEVIRAEWGDEPGVVAETARQEALARGLQAPLVLVGDGAASITDALSGGGQLHLAVNVPIEVLTLEIGRIGLAAIEAGNADDPLALQPLYVMPSAAERNLKGPGKTV